MNLSQSDTEQFGVCAPDRQTTFMRAGHNASWSTFLTADAKCGRCILVHWRCCCIDSGNWRNVFDHWNRRCIPENTATSVRCSLWRSSSGTSESTFGFFLELETFQLESYCSRDAVFSRRLHHRLRFVEWCLVQPHRCQLAGSSPGAQRPASLPIIQAAPSSWSSTICTAGSGASLSYCCSGVFVICFTSAVETHS